MCWNLVVFQALNVSGVVSLEENSIFSRDLGQEDALMVYVEHLFLILLSSRVYIQEAPQHPLLENQIFLVLLWTEQKRKTIKDNITRK